MIVRRAGPADHGTWAALLARMHGEDMAATYEAELDELTALSEPYIAFLAFADDGTPIGMIDARVRNYAEGAPDLAAPYVEDLWVDPDHRRSGVARALLAAVEQWARSEGHRWLGSDALIDNDTSHDWHRANGFDELERIVIFGKRL